MCYNAGMENTKEKFIISVAPLTKIALTRDQSFFYTFSSPILIGTLVFVSLGSRKVLGIVLECKPDFPRESTYTLKSISGIVENEFLTPNQLEFATFISDYYFTSLGIVLTRFVPQRVTMRAKIIPTKTVPKKITISPKQERIIERLYKKINFYNTTILHAPVTQEKIAILLSFIQKVITQNKQVVYVLPELMQAPFFKDFFLQFFAEDQVAILHSKIAKGEYFKKWQDIKSHKVKLIIGTRSVLFAPFNNLGAIIVDEVHDSSHKQWERHPLIDARTGSQQLAKIHDCAIIFTSASPRSSDYINKSEEHKNIRFLTTHEKINSHIEIVDMKIERWDKNKSILSRKLVYYIKNTLSKKKQIIIFVDRQGESMFSLCIKCRLVVTCPTCSRALVTNAKKEYFCVHCAYKLPLKHKCTKCGAIVEHIGIGTERVYNEIKKIFFSARVEVADSASMSHAGAHKRLFTDFRDKKIDIVIGTQMITKGWITENVALGVIIDMDHILSMPSYDANERAFNFIIQLASRAQNGTLLIQTFQPENSTIIYAKKCNFDGFHEEELALRKILHYPPFSHLIKITHANAVKNELEKIMHIKHQEIVTLCKNDHKIVISEPHDPFVNKKRSLYYKQILIKNLHREMPVYLKEHLKTYNTKWSIDIDPANTI